MQTPFRHHDLLRLFTQIARHPSFSEAAQALHMTKGAISYQIKTLETALGVVLFRRTTRGVELTEDGAKLLTACRGPYDEIEAEVQVLTGPTTQRLIVGVSTYFAARWLSPRLMTFMQDHQEVQLRIQPMIQFSDAELQEIDLAIRWGNGKWTGTNVTPFMPLPAFPVGNQAAARLVESAGIEAAFAQFTLLRDRDDSNAWSEWLTLAGLSAQTRREALVVPDPNVRVQAVIDGQGIALMDNLVATEMNDTKLARLSDTELSEYGYFLVRPHGKGDTHTARIFSDWLQDQT